VLTFIAIVASAVAAGYAVRHRQQRRIAGLWLVGALVALAVAFFSLPNLLYAQKIAGKLAMPAGMLWVAIGGLTYAAWWRGERLIGTAAAVLFVLYTATGSPAVAGALLYSLESDFRATDPFEGKPLDAVFVHGGGTLIGPTGRPRLADSGDRVLTAARVFHERDVGHVVTSGSSIAGIGRPRDVAAETADILGDLGVPPARVIEVPDPKNTSQEVAAYARLTREKGWTQVGVVTSAWHLRRATKLFEQHELPAEPLPADFRGGLGWDGIISLIPDGGGFRDVHRGCWEYLGTAVGR
jgi:uncharacterized SAM-binding protein YcdF (DUF218 family)